MAELREVFLLFDGAISGHTPAYGHPGWVGAITTEKLGIVVCDYLGAGRKPSDLPGTQLQLQDLLSTSM